jgi:hypothetical protein
LYAFKQCKGGFQYNSVTTRCEPYICTVANCVACNFSPNICTTCNTSISASVINNLYECLYPSCNTLNCALCMNSTYCETCLPGEVFISSGKCALNSTNNNINNNTKYTATNTTQDLSNSNLITKFFTFLNYTLLTPLMPSVGSLPSSRRLLKPFVAAFCNFDDLIPYFYH